MFPALKDIKHVACSRCRERKVKCDGNKPSCRRCEKHGHTCQYITGKRPQQKNEWVQHLRTFSAQPAKRNVAPPSRTKTTQSSLPSTSGISPEPFGQHAAICPSTSPNSYFANAKEVLLEDIWNSDHGFNTDDSNSNTTSNEWASITAPTYHTAFSDSARFNQDSPNHSSNYVSNFATSSYNESFPIYYALRSSTPASQASEATSFDSVLEQPLNYMPPSYPASTTGTALWNQYCPVPFAQHSPYTHR